MILGLTGGIASGKSTAIKKLESFGAVIIDSDKISHEISVREDIIKEMARAFGEDIITSERKLDRKLLRERVFSKKENIEIINSIMHPPIKKEILTRISEVEENRVIILDVPLLYEVNWENICDKVLLVYVDRETQITRIAKRDGASRELAEKIIDSQMSLESKKERADYIIKNNKTIREFEEEISKLYKKLVGGKK